MSSSEDIDLLLGPESPSPRIPVPPPPKEASRPENPMSHHSGSVNLESMCSREVAGDRLEVQQTESVVMEELKEEISIKEVVIETSPHPPPAKPKPAAVAAETAKSPSKTQNATKPDKKPVKGKPNNNTNEK